MSAKTYRLGIFYFENDPAPISLSLRDRIFCWKDEKDVAAVFVNLAFPFPNKLLNRLDLDGMIFDTTFLRRRWTPLLLNDSLELLSRINTKDKFVIAVPHDEYSSSDALNVLLRAMNCDLVLSCADNLDDYNAIYPPPYSFEIQHTLTTHVSKRLRKLSAHLPLPVKNRPIVLGYRNRKRRKAHGYLGEMKEEIGKKFAIICEKQNIDHDIRFGEEHWLTGADWYHYLGQCQSVLGAPSGASLLDKDGNLDAILSKLEGKHLKDFYAAPHQYMNGFYKKIKISTLAPRHIEAACLCTPQILIRSKYENLLRADEHYIPINADFSNLDDVIATLQDKQALQNIANRARAHVLEHAQLCQSYYCRTIKSRLTKRAHHKYWSLFILRVVHLHARISLKAQRYYQSLKLKLH